MYTDAKTYLEEVVRLARAEVGKVEDAHHNNLGGAIKYLATVGWPNGGQPWCAAYVNWCFMTAAKNIGIPNPWLPTASCRSLVNWAEENDILETMPDGTNPTVFLHYSRPEGAYRASHTGIVYDARQLFRRDPTRKFFTYEGNTNLDGSREGYGVFDRWRMVTKDYRFIHITRLLDRICKEQSIHVMRLTINGVYKAKMAVVNNRALIPARRIGQLLALDVAFDGVTQLVSIGHAVIPEQVVLMREILDDSISENLVGYVPIKLVAEKLGLRCVYRGGDVVDLSRAPARL